MDVKTAILTRRSITSYTEKKVKMELIAEILNIARYAPSSGNLQNWHPVIVTDEKKRKELAIASAKQMWMVQAPVHIVICNKLKDMQRYYGERGISLYSIQNLAALAQNILLMATSLGLASCWIGSFDKHAVASIIKAPDDETPEIIITLGYSKEKPKITQRYEIEKFCCHDECDNKQINFGVTPLIKHLSKKKEQT